MFLNTLALKSGRQVLHRNLGLGTFVLLLLLPTPGCLYSNKAVEQEPATASIAVNGVELNYVTEGRGTPCLVIGSSVYYPKTFSDSLRQALKLYFVDMRWFAGKRGSLTLEDFTLDTIVSDIEQVRLALGLEKPILAGHSIHGTIAMEYAKKYPENVSSLLLIGSPNVFGNAEYDRSVNAVWETASVERKELQQRNWETLAKREGLSPAQLVVENYCAMGPKYWNDPTYDAHWLWEDMTIQADLLNYIYTDIFRDYDMFEAVGKAPVPTLVVLGRKDFVIPPALWKKHERVRDLTIIVLEHSGHTPQLEEPEVFDRALLKWLGDLADGR